MLRLYQWLLRRASLLLFPPPSTLRQVNYRRVVTVESEERILLRRVQAGGEGSLSSRSFSDQDPKDAAAMDSLLRAKLLGAPDDRQLGPEDNDQGTQQSFYQGERR